MFNIFRWEGLFGGGDVPEITPEEAYKKISDSKGNKTIVIDVRESSEFSGRLGHIENSILVPIRLLQFKMQDLEEYKNKEVIVVCHSGARSYSACNMLKRHGFENVYNLRGGMLSWKKAGLKSVA